MEAIKAFFQSKKKKIKTEPTIPVHLNVHKEVQAKKEEVVIAPKPDPITVQEVHNLLQQAANVELANEKTLLSGGLGFGRYSELEFHRYGMFFHISSSGSRDVHLSIALKDNQFSEDILLFSNNRASETISFITKEQGRIELCELSEKVLLKIMQELEEEIGEITAQQIALEQQKEQEKIEHFNRKYKIKSAIE